MRASINNTLPTLESTPKIGERVLEHLVTRIQGRKIFGIRGETDYVPKELKQGEFVFVPGYNFANLKK